MLLIPFFYLYKHKTHTLFIYANLVYMYQAWFLSFLRVALYSWLANWHLKSKWAYAQASVRQNDVLYAQISPRENNRKITILLVICVGLLTSSAPFLSYKSNSFSTTTDIFQWSTHRKCILFAIFFISLTATVGPVLIILTSLDFLFCFFFRWLSTSILMDSAF